VSRAGRSLLGAVDAVLAAGLVLVALLELAGQRLRADDRAIIDGRGLLVLDGAYSLAAVRARGQQHSLLSRDLDGWFARVWHVHPLVGADAHELADRTAGRPTTTSLAPGHVCIEGHPGLTSRPRLPLSSFAAAQLLLLRHLHAVLRTGQVHVLRAGDPYYLGLLGLALSRAHRVPLVLRINGNYDQIYTAVGRLAYPRLFRRRWVEKRVDRFVLRRADLVAGANQDNLGFALANGTPAERGTVFPYGALIDPVHRADPASRPDVRGELGLAGRRILVAVTRLEAVKHTGDLLRVLALVRVEHPDAALLVVGEGSDRAALEHLAEQLELGEHVVLAGSRDQAWIAAALAGADVFVAPSAGRALVEGALAGLPLVAYDVDWHAELVVDGSSGCLVPFRNIEAMAESVRRLLDDPAEARRLGAGARALAGETMDPQALVAHERTALSRLIAARESVA
jgi:glycosyltransferase involved in cell wall biosynthesis